MRFRADLYDIGKKKKVSAMRIPELNWLRLIWNGERKKIHAHTGNFPGNGERKKRKKEIGMRILRIPGQTYMKRKEKKKKNLSAMGRLNWTDWDFYEIGEKKHSPCAYQCRLNWTDWDSYETREKKNLPCAYKGRLKLTLRLKCLAAPTPGIVHIPFHTEPRNTQ